ncbi:MAG: hypothetical protein ACE363_12950 [Alphaproteobacteria bacterium]
MRRSLLFSAVFHIALLAAILFGMDLFSDDPPPMITVVELIEYEEIAEEAASVEEPEIEPDPVPEPEPEEQPAPEEIAEAPARIEETPPPAPEPEPEPAPVAEAPEKPRLVTEDIPNIRPRTKPKPPSRFDTSRIAALLDKRQEEAKPEAPTTLQPKPDTTAKPKRTNIQEQRVRASIQQAIRAQISKCWNPPVGASYAETLKVDIHIRLRPDGNLVGVPDIQDKGRMVRDGFFRAAAEAGRRAIQRCAPFALPKEDYDIWSFVEFGFDPSEMM